MRIRRLAQALIAAVALLGWAAQAQAQAQFPTRPVRIVLPYAAGGGGDQLTRALAQSLSETWGQPVVVENRPGAGATIGTEQVVKSAPDGYTLLVTANTIAVSPAAFPKLPYDVLRDLTPIALLADTPYVLTVHPRVPAQGVDEFLRYARANPGRLNYASPGNGTLSHLAFELFRAQTGIEAATVTYKGSNPAMLDTIGGQVDFIFDTPAAVGAHVKAQKLRALAVTTIRPAAAMPGVPTLAQSGLPGFDVSVWFGLMAPAGVAADLVRRINEDTVKVLGSRRLAERLDAIGMQVLTSTAAELGDLLRRDVDKWSGVIRRAQIRFD
jgi:tripartite-type tricarboxylate transporter receptor subunit TctC